MLRLNHINSDVANYAIKPVPNETRNRRSTTALIKMATATATASSSAEMGKFRCPKEIWCKLYILLILVILVISSSNFFFTLTNKNIPNSKIENEENTVKIKTEVVITNTEASSSSTTGVRVRDRNTTLFVDDEKKYENSTTTVNHKTLPFRIVQIGAPRTGSTFQYELLKAIAHLKNPTVNGGESKVLFTHVPIDASTNEMLTNIFEETPSFIIKIHKNYPILKEYQSRGDISVFASSHIVEFATYVQEQKELFSCSMCEIDRYQSFFGLSTNEVNTLKEYMGLYEKIRQCCGMQISKYEILRLNGCKMDEYIDKVNVKRCFLQPPR